MEERRLLDSDRALLLGFLKQVDFFRSMSPIHLGEFLRVILVRSYAAGEAVCRQGAEGEDFFIVFEGRVRVRTKKGLFASSKLRAFLGPGEFFGEMSLLTRQPRTATVVCEESTRLFVLRRADFDAVVRQVPALAASVQKAAAERQADLDRDS